jgi:hypothetical protein
MSGENSENHITEIFPRKSLIPEIRYKKTIPPLPKHVKVPHEKIDLRKSKIDVISLI